MKYAILILTLFSALALATPPDNRPPSHEEPPTTNIEVINSNSEATANSVSLSGAVANGGNNYTSVVGGSTGESSSSANADGGASESSVGDISIDNSSDVANSVSSVFTQACQTGGAAQTRDGGVSFVQTDQLCDYYLAANVAYEAYAVAHRHGHVNVADKYLELYFSNIDKAQALLDSTEQTAVVDRFATQLFRPAGLLGLLIWAI